MLKNGKEDAGSEHSWPVSSLLVVVVVVCFCAATKVLVWFGVLVWWGHATEASEGHRQTRNQLQTSFSLASSNAYVRAKFIYSVNLLFIQSFY